MQLRCVQTAEKARHSVCVTRMSSTGWVPNLTILPALGARSCPLPPTTSFTEASETAGGFRNRMTGYRNDISEPMKPPPKIQKTILRRAGGIFSPPLSHGHTEPPPVGGQNPNPTVAARTGNGARKILLSIMDVASVTRSSGAAPCRKIEENHSCGRAVSEGQR